MAAIYHNIRKTQMNRKDRREVTVAATIGGAMGVAVVVMLSVLSSLTPFVSLSIAIGVSALAGCICYYPREISRVATAVITKPWRNLLHHKVPTDVRSIMEHYLSASAGIFLYVILLIATFVVGSAITVGAFMCSLIPAGDKVPGGLMWGGGPGVNLMISLSSLIGLAMVFKTSDGTQPSWWMPISARLSRHVDKGFDVTCDHLHYFTGWIITALTTLFAPMIFVLVFAILITDVAITLVLALFSTGRLSAVMGSVIGTIFGSIFYFHGMYGLGAIVVGGITGGLAGRAIYGAKFALTYKNPAPAAS